MSVLADSVTGYLGNASWIRRMFEAGGQLKARFGAENVYDFSLGNPDLPAPSAVAEGLRDFAEHAGEPFAFGYMPNGGFPWLREKLAGPPQRRAGRQARGRRRVAELRRGGRVERLSARRDQSRRGNDQLCPLLCGIRLLRRQPRRHVQGRHEPEGHLRPGPQGPGGGHQRKDAGGADQFPAQSHRRDLQPQGPHGPGKPAGKQEPGIRRPIWLVADEPYRFLAYDGAEVPSVLPLYPYAVCISSFSKNLSLPGERVGYVALSPRLREKAELMAGLTLTNRILGFVNPPVIGQHIMAKALGSQVDLSVYAARRKAMAEVLRDAGYEFQMPAGAFYFFPKAPGGDDVAFVNRLLEERVLAVPGSGFGCPGHFRLAFCVDESVIRKAADGFAKTRAAIQ